MSRRAGRARTPAAPQSPHNANPVGKGLRRTRSVRPTTVPPPLSAAGAGKVRLGDVCEEVSVRNRDGKVSSVYSVTNFGGFIPSTEYFSKEVYSKSLATYKIVKPGMFAYNPSRINVGSVNRWIGEAPVIVSPLYIVVNPDPRRIEGSYLNYFLHSKEALCQIRNLTEGTVRDSLKFSGFQRLTLPLPPLPIQQRIADELDRLCAMKKNAEDRLAILDQIVKSRFVEMFGDMVRKPRFSCKALGEIAAVGSSKRIFQSEYVNQGVPFYRSKEVVELSKGKEITTSLWISRERFEEIKARFGVPSKGDLLVTAVGTIGQIWIVDGASEFYYKDGNLMCIHPGVYLDSVYLREALIRLIADYKMTMPQGTAYAAFTIEVARKLQLPLPPIGEQRKFAAFVGEVDKSKLTLRETVATLDQLYRAKLQEYFG